MGLLFVRVDFVNINVCCFHQSLANVLIRFAFLGRRICLKMKAVQL